MNFDFTDDQRQFKDSVARFLASTWPTGKVRAYSAGEGDDSELWRGLAELGFHGSLIREEYGGLGLTFVDLVLIFEEFGRALATVPAVETAIAAWLISRHGTTAQKERMLPKIAAGKLRFAIAHQEAEAGYDHEGMQLSARNAAGGFVLDGTKILVPHADTADCLLVSALTEAGAPALFICERADSFSALPHVTFDPSLPAFAANFATVKVATQNLLGEQSNVQSICDMVDASAFAAAAAATGAASKALEMAIDYAKIRKQFGKIIGSFQAVKHKCAEMAVALDGARSAIYYAAWALSESQVNAPLAVSLAKAYCSDASRMICNESLQLHGGMGFTWDCDLHLYLKRAKVHESAYGNAAWHRERIARRILSQKRAEAEPVGESVMPMLAVSMRSN